MEPYRDTQHAYETIHAYFTRPEATRANSFPNDRRDINPLVGCFYRDAAGNKCAFGCLIPDDVYDPEMEGQVAHILLGSRPALRDLFVNVNTEFIRAAQGAHDNAPDVPTFLSRLYLAAMKYDLKPVAA